MEKLANIPIFTKYATNLGNYFHGPCTVFQICVDHSNGTGSEVILGRIFQEALDSLVIDSIFYHI